MKKNERDIRHKLKTDFLHYAEKCLKLRTKQGAIRPFVLNDAQKFIHAQLEEQLRETGKVRALILKGRQQGCSTYVEARFYWKVTHQKGVRAFILTHLDDATRNIYQIMRRFHEYCPHPVKPHAGHANSRELVFDRLDSGYHVGTDRYIHSVAKALNVKRADPINIASKPILMALSRAIVLHENGKPPVDMPDGWYEPSLYEQAADLVLPERK